MVENLGQVSKIEVNYVDNELYIIAVNENDYASAELLHYNSGCCDKMNLSIVPEHVLAAGKYTLLFLGINWGVESKFDIQIVCKSGKTMAITGGGSTEIGLVMQETFKIGVGTAAAKA